MSSLAQQIAHWENIKTYLKHAKNAQKSIDALLPGRRRSKMRGKCVSSDEEQTLTKILENMKTFEDPALTAVVETQIDVLTRALKEQLDADRFEIQAEKLVHMATAFKQGVKRKLNEGTEDEDGTSADELNEQLDVLVMLGKKLRSDKEENEQMAKSRTGTGQVILVQAKFHGAIKPRRPVNLASREIAQSIAHGKDTECI